MPVIPHMDHSEAINSPEAWATGGGCRGLAADPFYETNPIA
jgi:hypothetical protein